MQSTKKKTRVWLISICSVLMALMLVLSGVGVYFKLNPKGKGTEVEVNPLDFSVDAWNGTVDGLNFNENYAGRGFLTKTINSASSFVHFISEVNNGNSFENNTIYLNSNLDFKNQIIPAISGTFKGTFDGSFYSLMNVNIKGNALFQETENATIKNLGLYNVTMSEVEGVANQNSTFALVNRATNTNIENTFVKLGNANLVNEYVSNDGEHFIKNSFVDSDAIGLINKINTNASSENQVAISNCYHTNGEAFVASSVEQEYVVETNNIKATNKSDFASFDYSSKYEDGKSWCDYSYRENSNKLNFTYPLQSGFVKVFTTGSCYESVVIAGNSVVDATNLVEAFTEADKETEAEINLLVEKVFMEARAEVETAEVKINAVKNTTIVRGENNQDSMFVGTGSSKITIGEEAGVSTASGTSSRPTITLDGNREYIEENNLESGALIVANGGEVEIHDNVVIKDNINNSEVGYGGAVLLYNTSEQAKIDADFYNCHSTNGGGAVCAIGTLPESIGSAYNCSASKGGAVYIADEIEETTISAMRDLYGKGLNVQPIGEYISSGTVTYTGETYTGCTASDGGAFNISGSATITFENCTFNGCYAYSGAVVSALGGAIYHGTTNALTIAGECVFSGCYAGGEDSGRGGAIYSSSHMSITGNSIFEDNYACERDMANYGVSGGAIYCENISITGSPVFDSNYVESYENADYSGEPQGGAIYASNLTINASANATFLNNYTCLNSTEFGGLGGALCVKNFTIEAGAKATFNGNKTGNGGAIYANDITINGNVTLYDNSGSGEIYFTNSLVLNKAITELSTTSLAAIYVPSSKHIVVTGQLTKRMSVYKQGVTQYNSSSPAATSYVFEDQTTSGLTDVTGSFPFKVVNASSGVGVVYNTLKAKYGVISTATPEATVSVEKSVSSTIGSTKTFTYKSDCDGTISITSSNTSIANVVSYTSEVTANTEYTCTIATSGFGEVEILTNFTPASSSYEATIETIYVNVEKVKAEVTLSKTSETITYGNSTSFTYNSNVGGTITINSSDKNVASVTYSAKVLANTVYTAIIKSKGVGTSNLTVSFVPDDESYAQPDDKIVSLIIQKATLSVPANARWESNSTGAKSIARWDAVQLGSLNVSYQVQLVGSESGTVTTVTTSETSYDFYDLMNNAVDSYAFNVMAVSSNTTNANNSVYVSVDRTVSSYKQTYAKDGGVVKLFVNGAEITEYINIEGEYISLEAVMKEQCEFAGWSINNSTTGTTFEGSTADARVTSGDGQVFANSMLKTFTVGFMVNNSNYGSVSASRYDATYGSTVSVDANGVLSVGSNKITPTATASNAQFSYAFESWTGLVDTVTRDVLFVANFSRAINQYTISVVVADTSTGFGTLDNNEVTVDYGSVVKFKQNILTIGDNVITAKATDDTAKYSYDFDNWEGTIETVAENVTIYAHFTSTHNSYKVTFDPAGGTTSETERTLLYEAEYGELPTADKAGYTFQGWKTKNLFKPSSNTITSHSSQYCSNLTIEETGFTAGKGTYATSATNALSWGHGFVRLFVPAKVGTFTLSANYSVVSQGTVSDMQNVSGEINLYKLSGTTATHLKKCVISLLNGNATLTYSLDSVESGTSYYFEFPLCGNTVRYYNIQIEEGLTATEYSPYVNYAGDYLNKTDKVLTWGDHIVTADWKTNSYKLKFDANGGTVSETEREVTYLSTYGAELPTPTREGYTFNGWKTKNLLNFDEFSDYSNWSSTIAASGSHLTSNENKGYVLDLEVGETYTVSYQTPSATEFPDYLYVCKAVNNEGSLMAYLTTDRINNSKYTFTIEADTIYYLRMGSTGNENSFNNQMNKIVNIQLERGSTATEYSPYVAYAGEYLDNDDTVQTIGDHIVIADWTINTQELTFESSNSAFGSVAISKGGNAVSGNSIVVDYGTSIEVNNNVLTIGDYTITATPTASTSEFTYVFTGWTNAEGKVKEDRTITANFTNNTNSYTITFVSSPSAYGSISINGSTSTTSVTVVYGTSISYNQGTMTIGSNNIVAQGKAADAGYTYSWSSWSVASGTMIDKDMEITATFIRTPNNYTITYYGLTGATVKANPTTYNIETATFTLNNPTHPDYVFVGWKGTGITGTSTSVTVAKGSTGNREYTAVWNVTINVEASGNTSSNNYSVDVYNSSNSKVGSYTTDFPVIVGETYTFKVNGNVTSDATNNNYQILRIKLDNVTKFTTYSPAQTGINDSTIVNKTAITKAMTISFEYLSAYMMKVVVPANSIAGLTVNLVNNGNNIILAYTSQNAYIIADGTPVTFTVDSTPVGEIEQHSFIGFDFISNGATNSVGVEGGNGIQFVNFTHNASYIADQDVGVYTYSIASGVEISQITVTTIVTKVIDVITSAIPEGKTLTLESVHGLNKVLDHDTSTVMLYSGEWTVTEGSLTLAQLQAVFPNFTIKQSGSTFIIVVD